MLPKAEYETGGCKQSCETDLQQAACKVFGGADREVPGSPLNRRLPKIIKSGVFELKGMKVFLCMLLVLVLTFSLAGCFSGGPVKVDKDGNIIVKDKDNDGNDVAIGEKKWDKSKMHGLDAPKAKLETSVVSEDGVMYGFSGMKEKDAKEYFEALKASGFTYNSVTLEDYTFNGTNKDGKTISFSYDKENGSGSIMATKGEPPSDEDDGNGAVVGGTDKKWDSGKMGGLPDPGTKVSMYWTDGNITNYTLEAIPSFTNYVEKIKACGFTEDIEETDMGGIYIFTASNSAGDKVTFSAMDDVSTIAFEKAD